MKYSVDSGDYVSQIFLIRFLIDEMLSLRGSIYFRKKGKKSKKSIHKYSHKSIGNYLFLSYSFLIKVAADLKGNRGHLF